MAEIYIIKRIDKKDKLDEDNYDYLTKINRKYIWGTYGEAIRFYDKEKVDNIISKLPNSFYYYIDIIEL